MNNQKKSKSIAKLKKSEYELGATLTLKNAENLLAIAKFCHQNEFCGNGVSILITSLEELSKAAYLKIKAHVPNVVINDLDRFFYDHKWKHEAILRLYSKTFTGEFKTLSEKERRVANYVVVGAILIAAYFANKNNSTLEFDLEKERQQGFYVDFNNNTWQPPMNIISSEDFIEYIGVADKTFEYVKKDLFEGKLSDINMKRYIEELSDENVYLRKTYKC